MKTSTTIAFAAALMATTAHAAPVAGINIGDYVRVTGQNAIYNVQEYGVAHVKTWAECTTVGAACTSPKAITATDLAALELGQKKAAPVDGIQLTGLGITHYLKQGAMNGQFTVTAVNECADGTYQSKAPSVLADRVCTPHPTPAAWQRVKTPGTKRVPAVIENKCNANQWYDLTSNTCKALTVCTQAKPEQSAATPTKDRACYDEELQILTYKAKFTRYQQANNSNVYTLTNQYGDTKICEVTVGYWPSMYCTTLEGRVSITGLPKVQQMWFSNSKNLKEVHSHDAKNDNGQAPPLRVAKGVTCGAGLNCW